MRRRAPGADASGSQGKPHASASRLMEKFAVRGDGVEVVQVIKERRRRPTFYPKPWPNCSDNLAELPARGGAERRRVNR
jgi:hypothetical protein